MELEHVRVRACARCNFASRTLLLVWQEWQWHHIHITIRQGVGGATTHPSQILSLKQGWKSINFLSDVDPRQSSWNWIHCRNAMRYGDLFWINILCIFIWTQEIRSVNLIFVVGDSSVPFGVVIPVAVVVSGCEVDVFIADRHECQHGHVEQHEEGEQQKFVALQIIELCLISLPFDSSRDIFLKHLYLLGLHPW